jgi:hypothetical protein
MAKGRMLQKRISTSNKMTSLSSDTVRLLYTWLLAHLDINGNFYADPIMVNNLVFTRLGHSVKTVAAGLDELASVGLIVRYQIDGEVYLNYPDFFDKQPKLNPDREGNSDIPNITPESILSNSVITQNERIQQKTQYKINIREDKIKITSNAGFDDFWKAYPKKQNKKEAQSAWNKAKLPSLEIIISAIEKQKTSDQWLEQNGKFIPHPSTWINRERWNDELITGGNNAGTTTNFRDPKRAAVYVEQDRLADDINEKWRREKALEAANNPPGNT